MIGEHVLYHVVKNESQETITSGIVVAFCRSTETIMIL